MLAKLKAALTGEPAVRSGLLALGVVGVLLAVPFAACRYLPLVDGPMHQLELAIAHGRSVDGSAFDEYYGRAPFWLPYWLPVWLGQATIPLVGLSLASRLPLVLYVGALPLLVGLLCVASRRSPWFALLMVPFVYELNLSCGFIAYCLSVAIFVAVLAWTLHIEHAPRRLHIFVLVVLSSSLGFTHPQLAFPALAAVTGLVVSGRAPRRFALVLATAPAAVPLAIWSFQPAARRFATSADLTFMSFLDATRGMSFTIDTYREDTEYLFLLIALLTLLLSWLVRGAMGSMRDHRIAVIAAGAFVAYYVLPWDWNGQGVSLRMLLPVLALAPAMAPPDFHPSRVLRTAMLATALLGTVQLALTVHGFHSETARSLDPLIRASASRPRVAQLAYEVHSRWVNAPVLLHAGAWLVFERGGVYAESFDSLTSHHSDRVPQEQRMTDRAFGPSRLLHSGTLFVPRENELRFWDTWLVRWTVEGRSAPVPAFDDARQWRSIKRLDYTLHQRTRRK